MLRPKYKNVQPNELPVLYRSVYFTWLGRLFTSVLVLMLLLSPLDATYAADDEAASSTAETTETDAADITETSDSETAQTETGEDEIKEQSETTAENPDTEITTDSQIAETDTEELTDDESTTSKDLAVSLASTSEDQVPTATNQDTETAIPASSIAPETTDAATTSSEKLVEDETSASTSVGSASSTSSTTPADTASSTAGEVAGVSTTTAPTSQTDTENADAVPDTDIVDDSVNEPDSNESSTAAVQNIDSNDEANDTETDTNETATLESDESVSEATVTNSENRYQFADSECVAVADGSYYCQQTDAGEPSAAVDSVVVAQLDASGYSNIYLTTGNTAEAITDNSYDDLAPHYDPVSETVVWHRNLADVFQIVSYDLRTQRETQITDSATNNMQPVRSGDVTVWQRWSDGVWHVMLKDAEAEPKQISTGTQNNIAPYVSGGYVIWNVTTPNAPREVAVYEIATGNLSYIDDADGGQVTNPRFVLMYDTKFDNGDTVTKGFDPETGQVVPLGAVPAPLAPDIPSSDPVGETRALIQNKTNNEENEDGLQISTEPTPDPDTASSSATTTASSSDLSAEESDFTLTIPATSTASTTDGTSESESVEVESATTTELTEYDLPIAPFGTTTETMNTTSSASTSTSTQANNS